METSTVEPIVCKRVCCSALPAYRPMEQGPNVARVGALPSSCQVIENEEPAGILLEETGLVIKTFAWAKGARAARERTRKEESIVRSFGAKGKSGRS